VYVTIVLEVTSGKLAKIPSKTTRKNKYFHKNVP
jgi:hypothetical protein